MMMQPFPVHNTRKPRTRRARPRLELLEDRTAPAVLVVTTTSDTSANDGQLTLREAIQAATTNASVDGFPAGETTPDTIVFATALQGQTITLGGTDLSLNGGGDLSIIGPGGVKSGITVDGNNASRIFNASSPNAVVLMNLTITGGRDNIGAGLFNTGTGATTLTNVLATGNNVPPPTGANSNGGGIANGGNLTLNNTEVSNNTASRSGGGIFNTATLTLNTGSRITGNSATDGLSVGGGIFSNGPNSALTLFGTSVSGNSSQGLAGGIGVASGSVAVRQSTISENTTRFNGGGLFIDTFGAASIVNSTLSGNLANATNAGGGGGGLFTTNATTNIVNSTIVRNASAADGGGILQFSGTVNFTNSINSLNTAPTPGAGTPDRVTVTGAFNNNSSLEGGSPLLGPLQDNGGPTFTINPAPNNPGIINQGNTGLALDPVTGAALASDQRGTPRVLGNSVDRGAVERFSSTTTTTLAVLQGTDTVTGTATALPVTLRATVASSTAGVTPTGAITFLIDNTPGDPTDALTALNDKPVPLNTMGQATLPNVFLSPGASVLLAGYIPDAGFFSPSASQAQTITATVRDTVGVFDPNAVFALLNQNTSGQADFSYSFGIAGDLPVVGNWTGSASRVSLPGVVRNVGGNLSWTLSDDNPPVLPNLADFVFGTAGQIPLGGDWNGSGTDGIGLFNPVTATFTLKNAPSAGAPDFTFTFGAAGFLPVVGDWDGDGTDTVGAYDPATGQWFLAAANTNGTTPALFSPPFAFGVGGRPVAGDWNGSGTDGIGVFFPQTGANAGFGGFLLRQTPDAGPADVNGGNVILAGLDFWLPQTGNWGPAPSLTNELLGLSAVGVGPGAAGISDGQLQAVVGDALGLLSAAGADAVLLNALTQTRFVLGDLPGAMLGLADPAAGVVVIDVDAAGWGWHVDGTPREDSEFTLGPVAGVDLLSAVLHEMGHLAGHGHDGTGLMSATLSAGVRQSGALDALFGAGLGQDPHQPQVAIP